MVVFLTLKILRKLRIWVISSSQWNMPLVSIFFSYLKKRNSHSWSAWFLGVTQKYELHVYFNVSSTRNKLIWNITMPWNICYCYWFQNNLRKSKLFYYFTEKQALKVSASLTLTGNLHSQIVFILIYHLH